MFFTLSRGLCSSCCWFRLRKKKTGFVWAGRIYIYMCVCVRFACVYIHIKGVIYLVSSSSKMVNVYEQKRCFICLSGNALSHCSLEVVIFCLQNISINMYVF